MMRTASTAFLEALTEAGVSYIFANFGSDHPALIEAIAEARALGRKIPEIVTCPNEMVAMSAAHGHAQVSGRAQAVVVHVDCGTQSLAGAVHNAARGRVPVLVFAGLSPYTQEGELKGSRNEFIQWIQDVPDQRGIVRQYMKFEYELRAPHNVKQIVHRSLQIAESDPKGPVYLVGAREGMEAAAPEVAIDPAQWRPVAPAALAPAEVEALARKLAAAERPLVVTSFLGRNPHAVESLIRLCHALQIGVLESVPNSVNYPQTDPLYQGAHWNHPFQNDALAEADLVLVIDSDVPWIPTVSRPRDDAEIVIIDADPLKPSIPLWYLKASRHLRADAQTALSQLAAQLAAGRPDGSAIARRRAHWGARHARRREAIAAREIARGAITPEYLTACVRRSLESDADRDRAVGRHHQLSRDLRSHDARPAGHAVDQRRRIARLERRRRDRGQARGAGPDGRGAVGRRLLHVLATLDRSLDGAALQDALPAGRLQQSRLEGRRAYPRLRSIRTAMRRGPTISI